MARLAGIAVLLAVFFTAGSASAGPADPPFPSRIDFPAPSVDPATGVVTTNFSPEAMAIHGDYFYAGSTSTGEILRGNLQTGAIERNWVPASPAQPSDLHRTTMGMLVDNHNRLWVAGTVGMACGGNRQPACPEGAPSPQANYGAVFVYNATTGREITQFTVTNAAQKTMNDLTIADNRVVIANTSAPGTAPAGAPTEDVQFAIKLGPHGTLPPGDTPPPDNTGETTACEPANTTVCPTYKNPAVELLPTPNFTLADGIDTLPNGHVLITSVAGPSAGQMINLDPRTGEFEPIEITPEPGRNEGLPPLYGLDGVALDGNMLYAPENRPATAKCTAAPGKEIPASVAEETCPGDWAAIHLDPPNYLTGEVVGRLNSPAGSGLPPLNSPADLEQLGHFVYGITRETLPNPVTGEMNVTQTFIERLEKLPLTATGLPLSAVEGMPFDAQVASVSDPNDGPVSYDYPQNGSSVYGYKATIDWGDGTTSPGLVSGRDGNISIAGTHRYSAEGSYTVTTTVEDGATGLPIATATSTATVSHVVRRGCPGGPWPWGGGDRWGPGCGHGQHGHRIGRDRWQRWR